MTILPTRLRMTPVGRCKLRRMIRSWDRFFIQSLFHFWSDTLGGLGALAAFFTFIIRWQVGNAQAHSVQLDSLSLTITSLIYAGLVWVGCAAVIAAVKAYRHETKNGGWHNNRRVFAEPICVGVSVFPEHDSQKVAAITFDEAEPNSFVQYQITIEPPADDRASYYLEHVPGGMDGINSSLMQLQPGGGFAPVKPRVKNGGVRLTGRQAFLRVKLDPGTVPITARVYMTSFEIGAA